MKESWSKVEGWGGWGIRDGNDMQTASPSAEVLLVGYKQNTESTGGLYSRDNSCTSKTTIVNLKGR